VLEQTHNPNPNAPLRDPDDVQKTADDLDPNYGVRFSRVINKCLAHQGVPDEDLYGVIYENPDSEQKRKNKLEGYLLSNATLGLSEMVTDDDNVPTAKYKKGVRYQWSFDENRVLVVNMSGATLNNANKNAIRNHCDTNFGNGKVNIT